MPSSIHRTTTTSSFLIRHQNWVVKVDYNDGAGTGNVLWKLGQGGDFTLVGGTDPTDWQYAQHSPAFITPNTTGIFSLTMMDNGDDRMFPDGNLCGTGSEPACYSTIPVFQINESAKTATLTFRQTLPSTLYNSWGGNAEQLANGDFHYDLSGVGSKSYIYEVTPDQNNIQTVWEMHGHWQPTPIAASASRASILASSGSCSRASTLSPRT